VVMLVVHSLAYVPWEALLENTWALLLLVTFVQSSIYDHHHQSAHD